MRQLLSIILLAALVLGGCDHSTTEPARATTLEVASGSAQTGTVGAALATPVTVRLLDQHGAPMPRVPVTFAVTAGGGAVTPAGTTTGTDGRASASWTLGHTSGTGNNTLTVTAAGTVNATVTASAAAGPAAKLALVTAPSASTTARAALATQPAVALRDQFGNAVAQAGVTVTAQLSAGGGTLGGATTAATDAAGVARFVDLQIGGSAGAKTLKFTAGTLGADSAAVTVAAGPPAAVAVAAGASQTATVATAVATPPTVRVTDADGNAVSGVAVSFAVTAGGGSITGAAPLTDASGAAAVGGWTLGPVAGTGNNALSATAAGLAPVTFTASATAGAAAAVAIVSGDAQTGRVGSALASPLVVRVADAFGNPVAGATVTFAVTSGSGTLSASSASTDASGRAQTVWTLGDAGLQQSARASVGAGAAPASFVASVPVASITVSPGTVTLQSLGETAPLSATVKDSGGTTISGVPVTWSSSAAGTVTVSAAGIATAAANGSASITAAAGGVTSAPAMVTVQQAPVSLTVSPPFAVLGAGETLALVPAAVDARGNALAASLFSAQSRDASVATVSGLTATAQAPGVTNVVVSAGAMADSSRLAVVAPDGFAMLLTRSRDSVSLAAPAGSTLVLDLWMIRPSAGTGDLGAITGAVRWDPARLQYQSSTVVESGWAWFPNAANAGTGSLSFSSFSATGTAGTFVLARVTFTVVAGAGSGTSLVTPSVSTAGAAAGANITAKMQPVVTSVAVP